MAKILGVDIAKVLGQALGPLFLSAKLTKFTPGTRTAGDLSSGTNPVPKTYPCKGIVEDYREDLIDGTLVQAGDQKVLLLGVSLPSGVVPEPTDEIEIEKVKRRVVRVTRDPAAATYSCQSRRV